MKKIITAIGALAFCALTAACASQPAQGGNGQFEAIGPSPAGLLAQNPAADRQYVLGAFDKIGINVYQMPDLSFNEIQIDSTGQIILPQVGMLEVEGKTIPQVSDELKARLSDCCLVNPQVIITLREAVSQVITVQGAVRSPNNYAIRGRTTLLQALAMANGVDRSTANLREVAIFRDEAGVRTGAKFDFAAIERGEAPDPVVLPGDQIIVDTSGARSAWRDAISAVPFFGVFTAF